MKLSRTGFGALTLLYMAGIYLLSSIRVGLPALFPGPPLEGTARFVESLLANLFHLPLFGGFAFLIHRMFATRGGRYLPGRWSYALAFAGVFLYSVFDEIHQSTTPGRVPSAFDIALNLVGASMVLGMGRYSIRGFRGGLVLLFAAGIAVAGAGTAWAEPEARLWRTLRQRLLPIRTDGRIDGFEGAYRWGPVLPGRGTFPIETSRDHVTEGRRSLRVEFPPGEFAGIRSKSVPVDWSGLEALRLDVFHPGTGEIELRVRWRDYDGRGFAGRARLLPGGQTVTIPLRGLGERIDASGVRSLRISVTGRTSGPTVLYFDDLRVTRAGGP